MNAEVFRLAKFVVSVMVPGKVNLPCVVRSCRKVGSVQLMSPKLLL